MNNIDKEVLTIVSGVIVSISIMGLGAYFSSGIITMFGLMLFLGFVIYGSHR